MKKIVIVVLLAAAAGCGSKKSGSECDAAIAKGIENFTKNLKEHTPNPQITERMIGMMDKLKGVLIERCKADSWPPEVVSCFTTANNRRDMQACQSKLGPEQASKLTAEISQVMMGGMGMGPRMPPGMPGHPEALQGAGAAPGSPPPASPPTGSPDTPAAPAAGAPAAPPAAPAAPAGTPAPTGGAEPPAGGSASK